MSFFRCRQALKEISERTLRRIANAVLISEDGVDDLPAIIGDSQSLVFFFDDGLFAPGTFELLKEVELGRCDVAVFSLAHLGQYVYTLVRGHSPRSMMVGRAQQFRYRFHTNNYGLTSRIALSEHLTHMKDHVLASSYANRRGVSDACLDVLIGATNKTPCSAVVLRDRPLRENEYRGVIHRYLESAGRIELPREVAWMSAALKETVRPFEEVTGGAPASSSGAPLVAGR